MLLEVNCFGFGAPAPGQSYPSIYIVGWVNNVYGIWQSINDAQSWTQIGTYPTGNLDQIKTISGDPNVYGQVYVGFAGSGYAYLPATPVDPPSGPTLTSLEPPSSGDLDAGNTVTLTLNLSEAVTVAGGTPTLTPQRRRHRDLHRRLRHRCADLQLHRGGRAEHRWPFGDGGQSQLGDHHRRRRQCRQPVADRPDPDRPADRYHAADGVVGYGFRQRDHERLRRPRRRPRGHADAQPERGGDSRRACRH